MNKYLKIGFALCFGLTLFSSCKEEVKPEVENKYKNEQAFLSFQDSTSSGYVKTSLAGLEADAYIYMKRVKAKDGKLKHDGPKPKQTDYVKIHYQGRLLTDWTSKKLNNIIISNLDKKAVHSIPIKRGTSADMPVGLAIALQNMSVGDKVEVAIPWYLGFDDSYPYSYPIGQALHYIIELDSIDQEN